MMTQGKYELICCSTSRLNLATITDRTKSNCESTSLLSHGPVWLGMPSWLASEEDLWNFSIVDGLVTQASVVSST
jgi:hypothetical protein